MKNGVWKNDEDVRFVGRTRSRCSTRATFACAECPNENLFSRIYRALYEVTYLEWPIADIDTVEITLVSPR